LTCFFFIIELFQEFTSQDPAIPASGSGVPPWMLRQLLINEEAVA